MTKFIDVRGNDSYATAAAWTTVNTGHHQFVRLILMSQQYKNMEKKRIYEKYNYGVLKEQKQ